MPKENAKDIGQIANQVAANEYTVMLLGRTLDSVASMISTSANQRHEQLTKRYYTSGQERLVYKPGGKVVVRSLRQSSRGY